MCRTSAFPICLPARWWTAGRGFPAAGHCRSSSADCFADSVFSVYSGHPERARKCAENENGLRRLVFSLCLNLIKRNFFFCFYEGAKCYFHSGDHMAYTIYNIWHTKTEKYFRPAIFPRFRVLFSLFFTEFRFSYAIVVVIVFIVCLRIYLCVCICHLYMYNHTHTRT